MSRDLIAVVIAYACGGVLPGYWIGKYIFGRDIRKEGSGNIGATNASRVLGRTIGAIVLLLDVAKGAGAVWIARSVGGSDALAGMAAIAGHVFSPFLGFKGGKGVATGLGVFLMLAWKPTALAVAVFAAVLLISRRVAPSSCLAAITIGAAIPFSTDSRTLIAVTEVTAAVILIRHRSNIQRLIRGEEPKVF